MNEKITNPLCSSLLVEETAHFFTHIGNEPTSKACAVCDILDQEVPRSAIVICDNRSDARLVESFMRKRGYAARRLCSELDQPQAKVVKQMIEEGKLPLLVTTDFAMRDTVCSGFQLVIHYALVSQASSYFDRLKSLSPKLGSNLSVMLVGARDLQNFLSCKKALGVPLNEYHLPTIETLSKGRALILKKQLEELHQSVSEKDHLIGKHLLNSFGDLSTLPETLRLNLSEFLSRAALSLAATAVVKDLPSIEEELRPEVHLDEASHYNNRRQDDRFSNPREERSRGNFDRRQPERENSERRPSRREWNREQSPDSEANSLSVGEDLRAPEINTPQTKFLPDSDLTRLSISQGTAQGMSIEVFSSLAEEFADIKKKDLVNILFEETQGYTDVLGRTAKLLIENLNGIEYNGETLRLEITPAHIGSGSNKDYPAARYENQDYAPRGDRREQTRGQQHPRRSRDRGFSNQRGRR